MEVRKPANATVTDKQLTELALLYQFSNTLLSTIRLNKLIHLMLTALTSGHPPLFERAMLFLHNERTRSLQGMLGVTCDTSRHLAVVGNSDDLLSSFWDISDDVISQQRATDFCRSVRAVRIEIDGSCGFINQVMVGNTLFHSGDMQPDSCMACNAFKQLGISNFAAVPLLSRDKNFGMIAVDNPLTNAPISMDDLRFLRLFANQAGMAVENSTLYSRLHEAHISLCDARERLVKGERLAAVGEMAAKLAHELKNPLITIGGFARRLLKLLTIDSHGHRYADTISKEVTRLEKMLTDILLFSSKPMICFNYSCCDLVEILDECFEMCGTPLEDNGIRLKAVLAGGPWRVLGDSYQLKQVFLNLLLNACESMCGGGELTVTLRKVLLDKQTVIVSISDTGCGIPQEMLTKIFDPFFTTKPQGTGLGLAIVRRILQNHNGSIKAISVDQGAIFNVSLPLLGDNE